MSLQPRHRWIIVKLQEYLNIQSLDFVEESIKQEDTLQKLNIFLKGKGHPRLYFYYQTKDNVNMLIEGKRSTESFVENPILFATFGTDVKLKSKAVYFIKVGLGLNVSLDLSKDQDQHLICGVIEFPILNSLHNDLSLVYQPLLESRTSWGEAGESSTQEFLQKLNKFTSSIYEQDKGTCKSIDLKVPDNKILTMQSNNVADKSTLNQIIGIIQSWIISIETFLDQNTYAYSDYKMDGPQSEVEYWYIRMQKLTGIKLQLTTLNYQNIVTVIYNTSKTVTDDLVRTNIVQTLSHWKILDSHITESTNEAKDNYKYLQTIEQLIETINNFNPDIIIEIMPNLLNKIKLIYTLSRYYNTSERITNLFVKITNQLVKGCSEYLIGNSSSDILWDNDPKITISLMEKCLQVNECYQEQYHAVKEKLQAIPKSSQFDFSETQIFGKFDLLCRRLVKLIDMYTTIFQFNCLQVNQIEGMGALLSTFDKIIENFRNQRHNLLDFNNNRFDKDFVQFNIKICDMELSLRNFINECFDNTNNIEKSIQLFKRYQYILKRESLKTDLDTKLLKIFHNYGVELRGIQEQYENEKANPPIPRHMPPIAGNILWERHLLVRVTEPMKSLKEYPNVMKCKEAKKIIPLYNRLLEALVGYEYIWFDAWKRNIENAKSGLQATLIVTNPTDKKFVVNFDQDILQLVKEAKSLSRLDLNIPETAKLLLHQEEKYKKYNDELSNMLIMYEEVTKLVLPLTSDLIQPCIVEVDAKMQPGLTTISWTSMNIEEYINNVSNSILKLRTLIITINDLIENRIQKNLKIVSRTIMVYFPADESFTLEEFVRKQEMYINEKLSFLQAKNLEIEVSINDLLDIIEQFKINENIEPSDKELHTRITSYYNNLMYRSLLYCIKESLRAIKKRVCSKSGSVTVGKPFFEVDVQLAVPSVRLSPTVEEIQKSVNKAAYAVLRATQEIYDWGTSADGTKISFFPRIGEDMEIIQVCLLLTGGFHGTKIHVNTYLNTFKKYDNLWKDSKEGTYAKFISKNPNLDDFEDELNKFTLIENEIESLSKYYYIGALSLNTQNIKLQLKNECRQWKIQYSNNLHTQAHQKMNSLIDYIKQTSNKLDRPVDSLEALRYVTQILSEVKEKQSTIDVQINPILDMYRMLDIYLPTGILTKEERDQKSIIKSHWKKLIDHSNEISEYLNKIQIGFQKQLLIDMKNFSADVVQFRADFKMYGPKRPGISPKEAVESLRRYKTECEIRERKLEMYRGGEELFNLQRTEYDPLVKTKKEIVLLDHLYGLYIEVFNTFEQYKNIEWKDVSVAIDKMTSTIQEYDIKCKELNKKLREWQAYHDLRDYITAFLDVLPILHELSKESIKLRHWEEIQKLTGAKLISDGEPLFKLRVVMDAGLLEYKEALEEITESADKQQEIESKLNEVKDKWMSNELLFTMWKHRKVYILKGFGQILEDLEESILTVQTMLSMKNVLPFKELANHLLLQLSETSDILDNWIKVQLMWTSLESVFTGGDIAKQMPIEAKKFVKVDKDWNKLMIKAQETGNVIMCCSNETLRSTLPVLYSELEKCQKSLEGYLEQKRMRFPRFYFVSNPVLLQVLSQGSDPQSVQLYYEKIFDAIDRAVHDGKDKLKIVAFKQLFGNDEEIITLYEPMRAEGNIEDWLLVLEKHMQITMKKICSRSAMDSPTMQLQEFVNRYCSQFALLGVQFCWTADCELALVNAKSYKNAMNECSKKQLNILTEMSSWCLTDLGTKLNRTKIETLITIQVHQRDVFNDISRLYKERKVSGVNDFEWLKQARFYWKVTDEDRHGKNACIIQICDVSFKYEYEYLGCKERLVVTPLTDRCYITLAQALGMYLGGSPAGPAGTGKTETVKDLGRSLGIFVVVTNCTDQQRYTDLAKIFKGLCQAGLWGCFDEFNRIELAVLSVVAQQVLAITNAKKANTSTFMFPGEPKPLTLKDQVAYFITMNPGYQGRQELPENLKALFRSVAMMVPDREIIIKVKLCSVGYVNFTDLSKKFTVLYKLCEEQLSKQKHYDFGLRNILSVLRTAGKTKINNPKVDEEILLMQTLRDMNLSKFIAQDVPLFLSLLKDLFPKIQDQPTKEIPQLKSAIETQIQKNKLINKPEWYKKILQLYETCLVRHGIMVVGPSYSGKTTIIKILQDALSEHLGVQHKQSRMNPKAILAEEMFGQTDKLSGEWLDGVFASIWQRYNDRNRKDIRWLICDGPVDAIWIENLNSVLDDNKILTLANGDRIPMTDNVKLLFEIENLKNASPATVSRAGIIYVSESNLGWYPIIQSWYQTLDQKFSEPIKDLISRIFGPPDDFKHCNLYNFIYSKLSEPLHVSRSSRVSSFCSLLSYLMQGVAFDENYEEYLGQLERLFLFSLVWTIGSLLEVPDRTKLDEYLRRLSDQMPIAENNNEYIYTIYDYKLNFGKKDGENIYFEKWAKPPFDFPEIGRIDYANILIPTSNTERSIYLMDIFYQLNKPILITGSGGTAKTSTSLMFMRLKKNETTTSKHFNLSSATTPGRFQQTLEVDLEKRGGKSYGPIDGKHMLLFIDELSMPEPNNWGDQPTLELVRQIIETSQLAYLDKDKRGDFKVIEGIQYLCALNHPGSGKIDISERLKSKFYTLNLTSSTPETIDSIYGTMLKGWMNYEEMAQNMFEYIPKITSGTIKLWQWAKKTLLPTPSKFHYNFSLRELNNLFQGILRTTKEEISTPVTLLHLWRHETIRVFSDKLTNNEDKNNLLKQFNLICESILNKKIYSDVITRNDIYFVNFLREDIYDDDGLLLELAPRIYEMSESLDLISLKANYFLKAHNEFKPQKAMKLILFEDALKHFIRISRVLGSAKGNLLLVGVGGSGKRSLTQLASYIQRNEYVTLTITKLYNLNSFLDDIKEIYRKAGQMNLGVTFVVTENTIKDESFMEYLNLILTTGEIAGLFAKDELTIICGEIRQNVLKDYPEMIDNFENLYHYFIDTVRKNLHVVFCFSPVSKNFSIRARKFPGIITGTTIDWFLQWPEDALVAVATGYFADFKMECTGETKTTLMKYMGYLHNTIVQNCTDYFAQFRRMVYQTPRTFLSFIENFKTIYKEKLEEILNNERRINLGLTKLKDGAKDVEKMKIELAEKNRRLTEAERETNEMMVELQSKSMEAKSESDIVEQFRNDLELEKNKIQEEKELAEEDLIKAKPFLDEADRAVNSIKPADLNEMKKLPKPSDIIKYVFDCVMILQMEPLVRVEPTIINLGVGKEKKNYDFLKDSYGICQKGMLADAKFLSKLLAFCEFKKDLINEETIELLEPYFDLDGFTPAVARNASKAAEGLCAWVIAMSQYHNASKFVKPKLEALMLAEAKLEQAQKSLDTAEGKCAACRDVLEKLQEQFQEKMNEKAKIAQNAKDIQRKMEKATDLINLLSNERERWGEDSRKFSDIKQNLVGDISMCCAFLNYFGAFNQVYRDKLLADVCIKELFSKNIYFSSTFQISTFLFDNSVTNDWIVQGLPTDPLSIQNGILITVSKKTRFPLIIDPQGQGRTWILEKEKNNLPPFGVTNQSHPKFRDHLEFALQEGCTLIVTGIEDSVDPVMDPVLEKELIKKAKTQFVMLGSKTIEMNQNFMCYLFTRLPNPLFSPELQAKTTLIDFTVTMKGLEEQLLGKVIQHEQSSLEEQLKNVLASVFLNSKSLNELDAKLLNKLTENDGNLLDNEELINVLSETKFKANDVSEKLIKASETKKDVNEKRELYRPVATRGSILYFSIVEISLINPMYQTSLDQFLELFEKSMNTSDKSPILNKRVMNILTTLTYITYRYINRGIYEKDKLSFIMCLLFKILLSAKIITIKDVMTLLKGGASLGMNNLLNKRFIWMPDNVWLNLVALSENVDFYRTIIDTMLHDENIWKTWYENNEVEKVDIPHYELSLQDLKEVGVFRKMQLIRALREDRLVIYVNEVIKLFEKVQIRDGSFLPIFGPIYIEPASDSVFTIYEDMNKQTPGLFLLSLGADPSENIEYLSRKQKKELAIISMGEGQDVIAKRVIENGMMTGSWVLLQNCHLDIHYLETLEETYRRREEPINDDFRLFITTEPKSDFPIGLLHMSVKLTNEPPRGLKAGMIRSYSMIINQDRIERVDSGQWRNLLYGLCFMHSIVQERRKYGPLGWSIPYEYNDTDLMACMKYLEKHLDQGPINWITLRYMIGEVQYGGRITDDYDRRLFNAYTQAWFTQSICENTFNFNPRITLGKIPNDFIYSIPDDSNLATFQGFIQTFPEIDSPEIFGMHPNADLTYHVKEVHYLLDSVSETLPKESNIGTGKTREDIVLEECEELLTKMPAFYTEEYYLTIIERMGMTIPLNIFLYQEIQRFEIILELVSETLSLLIQAIKGEVVMTSSLLDCLNSIFDAKVPKIWLYDIAGSEISWLLPTLGLWFTGLVDRNVQLKMWLERGRPNSYWLTGFFNPQGFLTAMKQEVTRAHSEEKWSLDDVVYLSEVTDYEDKEKIKNPPKEGVYIYGLFLDGASWSKHESSLVESIPKVLYSPLPILFVTAISQLKKGKSNDYGTNGVYECPVYKYPMRTDKYLIFVVSFPTRENKPVHWILRGAALLCEINY